MSSRVPPTGPKDAQIMILGESPGRQEVLEGKPFVGPAGRILNNLLSQAGLEREEIYISNTVKTLPPRDKEKFFFEKGTPTKPYMDGILEVLEEIKEVRPNVVVPLGNYALWALCQQMEITSRRGSILESTLLKGQKLIPTIHPAWYLHSFQWHRFPLSQWDFQRIAAQSKFPEIRRPQRTFITDPSPEEIENAIERFTEAEILAADSEWYSPNELAYIAFSDSPDYAVCIPANSMLAYRAYKDILSSPVPKIWQNAMFDAVALSRVGIEVRNVRDDTMVAWHNCWTDLRDKKLATIASVLTEEPYYKEDLEFVGKDDERGQIYCCTDTVVTLEAMREIREKEFPYTGTRNGYEISMSIMEIFIEASKFGIRCDLERLDSLKAEYVERANELEDSVSKRIGFTVNCRSTQQVAHAIYDALGVKSEKRSTAQDVLMDLAASMHGKEEKSEIREILTDIIRVRRDRNLVSRYVNRDIVDRDGRIRCNWNLAGTRSGRLSTTKPWWNGVALQTVPDDSREIYIADRGHIFVGWDLGQAEARVVAALTGDFELLEDMEKGIDIHIKLAAALPFGLSYEEIEALCKERGKDNVDERYIAKQVRHGMNYILTWVGLKKRINKDYLDTGVGIDAPKAKDLRQAYLDVSTGLEAWWDEVYRRMKEDRALSNCFGRRRIFTGRVEKFEELHREGVSFEPQSTVADLTTISISTAARRLPFARFLLHMHDGGILQIPEDRLEETVSVIREEMYREIRIRGEVLKIPVDVKAGKSWGTLEYLEGR